MSLREFTYFNFILPVIYVKSRNWMKSFSLFRKRQNSVKSFWYFSFNHLLGRHSRIRWILFRGRFLHFSWVKNRARPRNTLHNNLRASHYNSLYLSAFHCALIDISYNMNGDLHGQCEATPVEPRFLKIHDNIGGAIYGPACSRISVFVARTSC